MRELLVTYGVRFMGRRINFRTNYIKAKVSL